MQQQQPQHLYSPRPPELLPPPAFFPPPDHTLSPSSLLPAAPLPARHRLKRPLPPISEAEFPGLQINLSSSPPRPKRVRQSLEFEPAFASLSLATPAPPPFGQHVVPPPAVGLPGPHPPLIPYPAHAALPVTPPLQQGESHHSDEPARPLPETPSPGGTDREGMEAGGEEEEDGMDSDEVVRVDPHVVYVHSLDDSPTLEPTPLPDLEVHPLALRGGPGLLPESLWKRDTGALVLYKPVLVDREKVEAERVKEEEWGEYRRRAESAEAVEREAVEVEELVEEEEMQGVDGVSLEELVPVQEELEQDEDAMDLDDF